MSTLFKRSNGVYYIIYEVNGQRKWKSTGETTRSGAVDVLLKFEPTSAPPPEKTTLSKFIEEFFTAGTSNLSAGSIGIYRQTFNKFLPVMGDVPLTSITSKHVDQYKTARLKTVCPTTLNIELRTLRAAFNTAIRWKLLSESPFKGVPLVRVPEKQPTYLSKVEFQKLLAEIKEQWFKDLIVVAVYTGLRRGELLNLSWTDIDLGRKLIFIQSSGTHRTKFGKRRTIPMSENVVGILQRRALNRKTNFIFWNGRKRWTDNSVSHKFKLAVRSSGINPDVHFHSLRHTFASWLVQEGVSLYEVQKLLGHSDIIVTQVYSHIHPETLHSTVNRISLPTFD
jgi:integrase